MADYSSRNLCPTIEPRSRVMTLPCPVGHAKLPYFAGDTTWVMYHRWSDHVGGIAGGKCGNCGHTLKEMRVRVNPKTGESARKASRIAREIALTPADVPPVRFLER